MESTGGGDVSDIPVRCRTNLDGYEAVQWPTHMVAVPYVGDRVEGVGGKWGRPVLRVVGVTHTMDDGAPALLVELHR